MNDTELALNAIIGQEKNWRRFVMQAAGLAKIWQLQGGNISTYHQLIDDDWDGNQAGQQQLQLSENLLQSLLSYSRLFSGLCDNMMNLELLGIAPLVEGVMGTFHSNAGHGPFMGSSISALVMGDLFYLQDSLQEFCEMMHSTYGNDIRVDTGVQDVCGSDVAQLQSSIPPGVYVMVAVSFRIKAPLVLQQYTSSLCADLNAIDTHTPAVLLRWIGCSQLHKGEALIYRTDTGISYAMLLPLADKTETGDARAKIVSGRPETILVVDDEDMIWDVVINMLGDLGYTVLLAANGKDAVDIYTSNPNEIDLVLMDMLMPVMNGRDAFHLIREADENARVILASGYVDEAEVQDVLKAGACGFMRKPFKLSDLATKVRSILDKASR